MRACIQLALWRALNIGIGLSIGKTGFNIFRCVFVAFEGDRIRVKICRPPVQMRAASAVSVFNSLFVSRRSEMISVNNAPRHVCALISNLVLNILTLVNGCLT